MTTPLAYAYTHVYAHTKLSMARVNVYLPDDLASEVRRAGLPVSPICQNALREELTKMPSKTQNETKYETITVNVGEDNHEELFRGRWLVEPDRDATRAGDDFGAYWGVAQTEKGNIAVFAAHCNERWPAQLTAYSSLDEADDDDLPQAIRDQVLAELGQPIWRDI